MVVATADCVLGFDVPDADADVLRRAQWLEHHAPHNVDRILRLDTAEARRKRELLEHMDDDRDKRRRREAYFEIQSINAALRDAHPQVVENTEAQRRRAEAGVANARLIRKRDWPLPLYDVACLDALRHAVGQRVGARCPCPADAS